MTDRASKIRTLARARLLDPSPAAVERLEKAIVKAMDAADWDRAERLLALRRELSPRVRDSDENLATLAKLAEGIAYAIAEGLKPGWDRTQPAQVGGEEARP